MVLTTSKKLNYPLLLGITFIVLSNAIGHWWISHLNHSLLETNNAITAIDKLIHSSWKQYEKQESIVALMTLNLHNTSEENLQELKSFFEIPLNLNSTKAMFHFLSQERETSLALINSSFEENLENHKKVNTLESQLSSSQLIIFLLNTIGFILVITRRTEPA